MKRLLFPLLATMAFSTLSHGEEDLKKRDQLADFIKKNLIGRTVRTEQNAKIANNTIYTEFSRKSFFSDLQLTSRGLTFKTSYVIEQTNYDLDSDGKRKEGKVFKKNRVVVAQSNIRQMRSTGELVGFASVVSNSVSDATGVVNGISVTLNDDALVIKSKEVNYGDYYAANDTTYPGVSMRTEEFKIKNGKLFINNKSTSYRLEADGSQSAMPTDTDDFVDEEI